ncbi:hypothetical protein BG015_001280, partial [Linnemannia schmuckeri]
LNRVFNGDAHPNIRRLPIKITVIPGGQLPANQQLSPTYAVDYPPAMLVGGYVPGLKPVVIPAPVPTPVTGAPPSHTRYTSEITNDNILTMSNLTDLRQNPTLQVAQAAHNPQAVSAAVTYSNPLRLDSKRAQRAAKRNGGSYDLFAGAS